MWTTISEWPSRMTSPSPNCHSCTGALLTVVPLVELRSDRSAAWPSQLISRCRRDTPHAAVTALASRGTVPDAGARGLGIAGLGVFAGRRWLTVAPVVGLGS